MTSQDLKIYHRAMIIKSMLLLQTQTCRPMEQNLKSKHGVYIISAI